MSFSRSHAAAIDFVRFCTAARASKCALQVLVTEVTLRRPMGFTMSATSIYVAKTQANVSASIPKHTKLPEYGGAKK